jgi:hypothetical protein
VFSIRSTGGHEQACARFGALEPPEPDAKGESKSTLTPGTSVTVFALGLPTQVSTSTPSITSLVQFATGSAEALGAAETATTTSLAATTSRPDRISR